MNDKWLTFLAGRPTELLPLTGGRLETFESDRAIPALLRRGAVIYRYGTDLAQAQGGRPSKEDWLDHTFEKFDYSDDVVEYCSLLNMTVREKGGWNEGFVRATFVVERDLPVWIGLVKGMTFHRESEEIIRDVRSAAEARFLFSTAGGATQILVPRVKDRPLRFVRATILLGSRILH